MYYRLDGSGATEDTAQGLDWILQSIAETKQFVQDSERMEAILRIDPEILCSRQNRPGACDSGR